MIYTIEFELPDNETVIKNIKTARVSWSVWGYSGVTHAQPVDKDTNVPVKDCISRQAAIEVIDAVFPVDPMKSEYAQGIACGAALAKTYVEQLPSAQPEHTNSWYINSWCIDCKEYDTENKCCPRYNRVIKQTLDDAYRHGETEAEARFHSEIVRCKYCKHFEYDHPYIIQGVPVLGHEVCNAWGNGCKTDENGYCFLAERRTDGV